MEMVEYNRALEGYLYGVRINKVITAKDMQMEIQGQ